MKTAAMAILIGIPIIVLAYFLQIWLHVSADGVIAVAALGIATVTVVEERHD